MKLIMITTLFIILTSCDIALVTDYSLYDMPNYNIKSSTLKNKINSIDCLYKNFNISEKSLIHKKLKTIDKTRGVDNYFNDKPSVVPCRSIA